MVTLADSLVSSALRPLPLRMRPDLTARLHRYQGRSYWVVKEPVGLKYYRFQEEEYAILQMLDGSVSFQEIKQRFERQFAPQKITLHDLQQFIGMLHRSGLVIADAPGQGKQLKQRHDELRRKELWSKLANVLAIRFKGIDPDRLLSVLHGWVWWLFSPLAVLLWAALALAALTLVTVEFDVFHARLPAFHEFFGPRNWFWLGLTLAVTKVLHEFGHGLSCKHFGGECHEMGVMFLVLTPCLYCNVSDSWLLPSKWQRAAIGAAGMYVEVGLASIATFLWWFSEPGMLNHLALRVMFICSISTILFNGNPLLRFDGYYILADLIEIPNLRQKSSRILQRLLSQWCLGLEVPPDPFLPQRGQLLFAFYTLAAVIYRWVVMFSILFFLNKVLEPYRLKVIGQTIALAGLFGLVVQPLWQFTRFLHVPGRMHQVKRHRVVATLAVVGAVLAAVVAIPLPYHVRCSLEVAPRGAQPVYVDVPGRLDVVHVRAGQQVREGENLAELSNVELEAEVVQLEGRVGQYETQLVSLRRQRFTDDRVARQIPQLEETLHMARKQLDEKRQDLDRLQLVAPADGTVLPAPPRPDDSRRRPGQLPLWAGSPLDTVNHGAHLTPGDQLCLIGNPHDLEAVLVIDQADIEFVRPGQEVQIKLDAYPAATLRSEIEDIARVELQATPPSLSSQAGGELATRTDPAGMQRPLSTSYQARAALPEVDEPLQPGLRGRGKIAAQPRSLGWRLGRFLARTFHFEI